MSHGHFRPFISVHPYLYHDLVSFGTCQAWTTANANILSNRFVPDSVKFDYLRQVAHQRGLAWKDMACTPKLEKLDDKLEIVENSANIFQFVKQPYFCTKYLIIHDTNAPTDPVA